MARFFERVSKRNFVTKCTAHTNFSDDAIINSEIKNGEWRDAVSDLHCNVSDLKQIMYYNYDLDEAIVERLEFCYKTKVGNKGNTKWIAINDDSSSIGIQKIRIENDSNLPNRNIVIDDITVQVRYRLGDEIEEDASCDSAFMIPAMDRVGEAIRKAYY